MMKAIAEADLGDSARGDDPTVNALERLAASISGKEAAIFVPSGTMGNIAAILAHAAPGDEIVLDPNSHINTSELGGLSALARAEARTVPSVDGVWNPATIARAVRQAPTRGAVRTGLICLENTHNSAGGTVTNPQIMRQLHEIASAARVPLHLDGARLFNAATYLGCTAADLCRHADSVMFSISKGLSAPIGSILAGDADFIVRARSKVRMLGGAMRQAGIAAAAGVIALSDPYELPRRDHRHARMLAEGLSDLNSSLVDMRLVQTNIVYCRLDAYPQLASGLAGMLRERGVLVNQYGSRLRLVTHRHIDEAAVEFCLAAFSSVIRSL